MTDETQPTIAATLTPAPTASFGPSPFATTTTLSPAAEGGTKPKTAKQPATGDVAEAITLLQDAKERLAVNSLSDVGYFIGRAIWALCEGSGRSKRLMMLWTDNLSLHELTALVRFHSQCSNDCGEIPPENAGRIAELAAAIWSRKELIAMRGAKEASHAGH